MNDDDEKKLTSPKHLEAQRKRSELVRDLGLRDAYPRDHSPSGTYVRRIFWNPETGKHELAPEPRHADKPKREPDDPRHENLKRYLKVNGK